MTTTTTLTFDIHDLRPLVVPMIQFGISDERIEAMVGTAIKAAAEAMATGVESIRSNPRLEDDLETSRAITLMFAAMAGAIIRHTDGLAAMLSPQGNA